MACLVIVLTFSPPSIDATVTCVVVTGTSESSGVVSVVPEKGQDVIPVLGLWVKAGESLVFTPRFPFEPGIDYQVILAGQSHRFAIPHAKVKPGRVVDLFPRSDRLPANLLRFYLHFDREMRQGQGYSHFELQDEQKKSIPAPFLILDEELWSEDGKRLTLLMDPGRVKQELVPRKEQGPVLLEGQSYTLVIRKEFKTLDGRPLHTDFLRPFQVMAPLASALNPADWKINSPRAASREALELQFDRLLDHALLQRVLSVETPGGRPLPGAVQADVDDSRWRWCPEKPWVAGEYRIIIQGVLEDVSGNRIGAAFDAKLGEIGARALKSPTKLKFYVK